MENARKMLLIPPETLNRLQQNKQPTPETTTLSVLDKEMIRILKLTTLTDFEKWTLYKQALQKYLHFTNESKKTVALPLVDTHSGNAVEDVKANGAGILKQTLDAIPMALRTNAESLYNYVQALQNITWDNRGVVSVNNIPLQGSNITDLISDIVRDRKRTSPAGWELFSKTLATANVPEAYIGNSRRRKFIRQQREPYSGSVATRKTSSVVTGNSVPRWERFSF